jgi:uncharacterized protein (DUF302 family)
VSLISVSVGEHEVTLRFCVFYYGFIDQTIHVVTADHDFVGQRTILPQPEFLRLTFIVSHQELPMTTSLKSIFLPLAAALSVAGFVAGVTLGGSHAAAESLTTVESKFPVKETLDRLSAELERRGIKVAARIDHAAGAKAVGMELPPTEVLMFGNPKLGTPLMQSNPAIGIDLPMKVLAWQDKAGKVWIGYNAADDLAARHGIKDRDEAVKAMAGALGGLVKGASGQP